jgi:hypothetical protein
MAGTSTAGCPAPNPPFSGVKQSGWERELDREELAAFLGNQTHLNPHRSDPQMNNHQSTTFFSHLFLTFAEPRGTLQLT